jgi:hypothetical protein
MNLAVKGAGILPRAPLESISKVARSEGFPKKDSSVWTQNEITPAAAEKAAEMPYFPEF